MFWGNGQDGRQRGFIHQIGDIIEEVFRPTTKRQELLLQQLIARLDRENNSSQELLPMNSKSRWFRSMHSLVTDEFLCCRSTDR